MKSVCKRVFLENVLAITLVFRYELTSSQLIFRRFWFNDHFRIAGFSCPKCLKSACEKDFVSIGTD